MAKIGYVRVSSDKQDPASQVKLMQDMGILTKDIFVDTAISGATKPETRPSFKSMIKRIDDGKDVDELVFSEFSRIGRTIDDSLMALIPIKQRGITIRSLSSSEKFINELPGPLQTFMISGMMYIATMEKQHNNERTKWGIENARANGKIIGRPTKVVDFAKIKEAMEKYNLKEKQAVRVCGYSESTFYKAKREKE
jgi:DNA invertase Pin-like site-specific DNA recombinase